MSPTTEMKDNERNDALTDTTLVTKPQKQLVIPIKHQGVEVLQTVTPPATQSPSNDAQTDLINLNLTTRLTNLQEYVKELKTKVQSNEDEIMHLEAITDQESLKRLRTDASTKPSKKSMTASIVKNPYTPKLNSANNPYTESNSKQMIQNASTHQNIGKQASSSSFYDNIECPKCSATGMKCPALSAVKDMEEKCFVCKSKECNGTKCLQGKACCYGCHVPMPSHSRENCPAKNLIVKKAWACRSCHAPFELNHKHRGVGGNNSCVVKDRIRLLLEHAAEDVNAARRECLQSACKSEKGWFEAMHNCTSN
jgi:hypothetical protein